MLPVWAGMAWLPNLGSDIVVKVGVLGCGDWGTNHATALASLGVLGAVADQDPARGAALGERFNCPVMTPADLIAAPNVQGVVLALPPDQHSEVSLRVLHAGKHLLVEKPMALSVAAAAAISRTAHAAGAVAMTGHLLRFHPAFEALQALIADGTVGEIRHLQSTRTGLGKFFRGIDVVWDFAPHDLSLVLALTGSLPVDAHLDATRVASDGADIAHLHLNFPKGIKADCYMSRVSPHRERKLTVTGTLATAVFDDLEGWPTKLALHRHEIHEQGSGARWKNTVPEYLKLPEALPLTGELRHFLNCIRTGDRPRSSVAEGLEVVRIIAGLNPYPKTFSELTAEAFPVDLPALKSNRT